MLRQKVSSQTYGFIRGGLLSFPRTGCALCTQSECLTCRQNQTQTRICFISVLQRNFQKGGDATALRAARGYQQRGALPRPSRRRHDQHAARTLQGWRRVAAPASRACVSGHRNADSRAESYSLVPIIYTRCPLLHLMCPRTARRQICVSNRQPPMIQATTIDYVDTIENRDDGWPVSVTFGEIRRCVGQHVLRNVRARIRRSVRKHLKRPNAKLLRINSAAHSPFPQSVSSEKMHIAAPRERGTNDYRSQNTV